MKAMRGNMIENDNPIGYRGVFYSNYKFFEQQGQHRSCSPEDTIQKMLPIAKRCGVTRVADITGLDRIGVPVTSVIRPNSLTLTTASGKGLTKAIAKISGIMESIELYHAENVILPNFLAAYNQIPREIQKIDLPLLSLKKNSLFNPDWPEYWTCGWDIVNQEEVAVPLACVQLKKIPSNNFMSLACFHEDSNGLASGNNFTEALCSAIFEVIERDAITCVEYASASVGYEPPSVDLQTITFPSVQKLLKKLRNSDVSVSLYDCTIDTTIPVFKALVYDKQSINFGPGGGYGAHLDPEVAILRAITEAIQGRAVVISGSRDDVFRFDLFKIRNSQMNRFRASEENRGKSTVSHKSQSTNSFHGDISLVISKLEKIGINRIVVFDLKCFDEDFSVVKILIPGLEGYKWKNSYQPGCRAKIFASKNNFGSEPSRSAFIHLPAGGGL